MTPKLENMKLVVTEYYLQGHSLPETAAHFGIAVGSASNILVSLGISRRSRSEGNKLKWTPDERERQSKAVLGNRRVSGKTWTMERPVHKPTLRGARNPSWKGGKTPLNIAIRGLSEYTGWRKAIFKRDNNTCVQCQVTNTPGTRLVLEVDHIIPPADILQKYGITSIEKALACDAIWDINNGRVLRKTCHKPTDTYAVKLTNKRRSLRKHAS